MAPVREAQKETFTHWLRTRVPTATTDRVPMAPPGGNLFRLYTVALEASSVHHLDCQQLLQSQKSPPPLVLSLGILTHWHGSLLSCLS